MRLSGKDKSRAKIVRKLYLKKKKEILLLASTDNISNLKTPWYLLRDLSYVKV